MNNYPPVIAGVGDDYFNLAFPKYVIHSQVTVDDKQIAEHLEPICKEFFDTYMVIGYRADDHALCCCGDLGRLDKLPQLNRKMQPVFELAKRMEVVESEENKKGLAGF